MKDEKYKEKYKEEQDSIHAPSDLIALTKKRAAREEKKIQRKRRQRYYYTAAAAAILVICILAFPLYGRPDAGKENQTKPYLGQQDGRESYPDGQLTIERTAILPMEFTKEDVWEEEIEGVPVKFTIVKNGMWMAVFEEEKSYVLVTAAEMEKEEFQTGIKRILEEYEGNDYENR